MAAPACTPVVVGQSILYSGAVVQEHIKLLPRYCRAKLAADQLKLRATHVVVGQSE
jgi:hypothetical protein